MALCLFHDLLGSSNLMLIAGYESGHVCVYRIHEPSSSSANGESTATGKNWEVTYIHKTHSQPGTYA